MALGNLGTVASGTGTAVACTCPTVNANETIMFVASVDNRTAAVVSGPSGMTQRVALSCTADGHKMWVYWKNAAGTESASTLTLTTDTSATWRCVALSYTGRSTSLPAAATTATSNTPASPTVSMAVTGQTPAGSGCDAVYLAICDHTSGSCTYAPSSGFVERYDSDDGVFTGFTVDDKVNTASATGTVTGVATPAGSGGFMAALILLEAAAGATFLADQNKPIPQAVHRASTY